ncbi:MAG TPA: glycosyltransferase family 2 protein [Stellaceae bacterium]|nr:glycosyltransferase family 2 protein [Stellaceae bacterium]
MSGFPTLSALVVARNEEKRLASCLERLRFADEIVVVLDRSTDRSAEIAASFGARLIEGAWEREGPRRNAGIAACRSDWILEVDADEWVTPELAAEITRRIAAATAGSFTVPMANHIGTRLIRHGWGAYNGVARKASLFRAGSKEWGEGRVHPAITLTGPRQALHQPMLHFVYQDLADMIVRINRYTDLAAKDAIENGRIPRLWPSLRRIWTRAWKSYVARRGYREGAAGMALALLSALYPFLIYLKVAMTRDHPNQESS